MSIPFPAILSPSSVSFRIENASRSGGASIGGAEQVTVSDAGRWRATMTIPLVREEWILSFRGWLAALDGRAGEFEVGPFDAYAPHDINGRRLSPIGAAPIASNDGGLLFQDNSAFGQDEPVHAQTAASAALRATRITVSTDASWMAPRPGQYFGIGKRLHICIGAYRANVADPWTIDFRPPLRSAVASGERVITDRPVSIMRLANDDTGALSLEYSRWGSATLELVEAI